MVQLDQAIGGQRASFGLLQQGAGIVDEVLGRAVRSLRFFSLLEPLTGKTVQGFVPAAEHSLGFVQCGLSFQFLQEGKTQGVLGHFTQQT